DRLVLGLATVGLVVTAATYVSVGGVGPLRAGLFLVKDGRQGGRLGGGVTEWGGPCGARGRRCAGPAAGGRERVGVAARRDHQRDQGGVPRREGRRAGAAGERRRT